MPSLWTELQWEELNDWSNFHLQRDTFYARVGVVINEAIADSSTLPLNDGRGTANLQRHHFFLLLSTAASLQGSRFGVVRLKQFKGHQPSLFISGIIIITSPRVGGLGLWPSFWPWVSSFKWQWYICSVMAGNLKSNDFFKSRGHLPFTLFTNGSVDWMKSDTLPPVVYSLRLVIRRSIEL